MESVGSVLTGEYGPDTPPSRHERHPSVAVHLPTSATELDEFIAVLIDEIGIILVQLAESAEAWCARTGRSAPDYAAWRRRALIAKAHKEQQLRECKRRRRDVHQASGTPGGALAHFEELVLVRGGVERVRAKLAR